MLMASGFLAEAANSAGLPFPYVPMAPIAGVDDGGTYWISFGHTVCALACAPGLLAMARVKEWWVNRALGWKPTRFLGRMSYTLYVWHTLVYFVVLDLLGGDDVLGEKWRAPILTVVAVVACLPIFFGVEQRMLRMKLRFATEKEVLDLNTGRMVGVDELASADRKRTARPAQSAPEGGPGDGPGPPGRDGQ
jgi:peptidoglycan/LPS O-acetylase OafA/YrhL